MFKVKLVKNNIPNLIKRFKELGKSKFEIGYFPTNGIHPSGLTFSGLFAIQSFGSTSANIPSRPVLDLEFSTFSPLNKNILLKNQLKKYFSNIAAKTPPITTTILLESVVGAYVVSVRNNFGNTSVLADNAPFTQYLKQRAGKVPNSPLLWTNSLRDNLSYSINGNAIVTPA